MIYSLRIMLASTRTKAQRAFLIVLAALLVVFVAMMRPFWAPMGLAVVTVIMCSPFHQSILKFCRYRYLAAIVSMMLVCLFILIPLSAIIITVLNEIIQFSQHLTQQLQYSQLAARLDELNAWVSGFLSQFESLAAVEINLREALLSSVKTVGHALYQFSPRVIISTAHIGLSIAWWIFFVFVFFAEGPRLYHYLVEISPLSRDHERILSHEVRDVINASFLGSMATALVNALLIGLFFWISPLDKPFTWGLVSFGLSFIPVIGAVLVWGSGSIYLMLIGEWGWGIGFAAAGLGIISQMDNVVKPLVMHGRVNIHPILLLLGLLGGVSLFGAAGLVFGPVFMAILLAAVRIYHREFA